VPLAASHANRSSGSRPRGEREDFHDPERDQLSAVEIVAVGMVLIVVIAFEVWFFFFSSSPIDQRSGRG
jgi:hypothetical protein